MPGMLITGGYQDPEDLSALSSAEVFLPSLNTTCSLPTMVSPRSRHSLTGLLACGGEGDNETSTSCELFQAALDISQFSQYR